MEAGDVTPEPSRSEVQDYFVKLGIKLRSSLKLHKVAGLWERTPTERKRDWGNVSEHCLVEAARAEVLSDLLGFPPDLKNDLRTAGALHDYFKRREKEIAREEGNSESAYAKAEAESLRLLTEAGFSQRVIYLASGTGTVESIKVETPRLLAKQELTEDEITYLVLHYIDDYTIGSQWSTPAEVLPDGGMVNDFDRRMDNLDRRYPELKEEGFNDFQRNVGHQVEERLERLIRERTSLTIEPKKLPEVVDQEIKRKMKRV